MSECKIGKYVVDEANQLVDITEASDHKFYQCRKCKRQVHVRRAYKREGRNVKSCFSHNPLRPDQSNLNTTEESDPHRLAIHHLVLILKDLQKGIIKEIYIKNNCNEHPVNFKIELEETDIINPRYFFKAGIHNGHRHLKGEIDVVVLRNNVPRYSFEIFYTHKQTERIGDWFEIKALEINALYNPESLNYCFNDIKECQECQKCKLLNMAEDNNGWVDWKLFVRSNPYVTEDNQMQIRRIKLEYDVYNHKFLAIDTGNEIIPITPFYRKLLNKYGYS